VIWAQNQAVFQERWRDALPLDRFQGPAGVGQKGSELLAKATTLPVCEIQDNTTVERNRVYVIPPNCDLSISGGVLKLQLRQKKAGGPARSIDRFATS
jgi:chemotaxis response regulator CheB